MHKIYILSKELFYFLQNIVPHPPHDHGDHFIRAHDGQQHGHSHGHQHAHTHHEHMHGSKCFQVCIFSFNLS